VTAELLVVIVLTRVVSGFLYALQEITSIIQYWYTHVLVNYYLPCHEVGMAGNVLMLLVVSVCLQILNSFNVSGMDEATLFKFGKWVEYGRVHLGVKNFQ